MAGKEIAVKKYVVAAECRGTRAASNTYPQGKGLARRLLKDTHSLPGGCLGGRPGGVIVIAALHTTASIALRRNNCSLEKRLRRL